MNRAAHKYISFSLFFVQSVYTRKWVTSELLLNIDKRVILELNTKFTERNNFKKLRQDEKSLRLPYKQLIQQ